MTQHQSTSDKLSGANATPNRDVAENSTAQALAWTKRRAPAGAEFCIEYYRRLAEEE